MSLIGAQVLVPIPELSAEPIDMRIAVPDGEDYVKRIRTYARVMARVYARNHAPTHCSWCEGELATGRVLVHRQDGLLAYCSPSCLIASL